jgi:predicted nucleotidyltransferase component of viral defense system
MCGDTMSQVLNQLQNDLLVAFFNLPLTHRFVLTGGTALAGYYLHHRLSEDLDLFTLDSGAFEQVSSLVHSLAEGLDATCDERKPSPHLHQAFFSRKDKQVKMDIVLDVGPWFGTPQNFDGIWVDALENIAANKIVATFGRATPRDFADLYFILNETDLSLNDLLDMAKQKDTGLHEFYLAGWIHQEVPKLQTLPSMIKPLTVETLKKFGEELARNIMLRVRPAD